jgi:flagellin
MAENAARHLSKSYDALSKSVERLSSGLRINSSKDDAAGLAVRELIRADVAQIKQGARNAQDGISMLQTAEGAMAVVDQILIRMKELAEQAATGSYSTDQRGIINEEFGQLSLELTRIAETTTFNSIQLLDSSATFSIHIGSDATIDIAAQVMDASALGLGSTDLATMSAAISALSVLTDAILTKDGYRSKMGYLMNRLEAAVDILNIQSENLMAAESRVSDVDVATEMAEMTRNQVLAQAGISMLTQANTMPQMALQLLRG